MKIRLKTLRFFSFRILAFSLSLLVGLFTFFLFTTFEQKTKTYILLVEIFDQDNRDKFLEEHRFRPNPLVLLIKIDTNQNITLINEEFGNLKDTTLLEKS